MKNIIRLMIFSFAIASCTSETETNHPILTDEDSLDIVITEVDHIDNNKSITNFNKIRGTWESNNVAGKIVFKSDSTFEDYVYYNTTEALNEAEESVKGHYYIQNDLIFKVFITGDTICQRLDWVFDNVISFSDTSTVYNKETEWENGYTKI